MAKIVMDITDYIPYKKKDYIINNAENVFYLPKEVIGNSNNLRVICTFDVNNRGIEVKSCTPFLIMRNKKIPTIEKEIPILTRDIDINGKYIEFKDYIVSDKIKEKVKEAYMKDILEVI